MTSVTWATLAIRRLQAGETVIIHPRGHSMMPVIRSGQAVTVSPVGDTPLAVGDVVLCRVHGRDYLHRIGAMGPRGYLISNAAGRPNGWVSRRGIFGRAHMD